MVTRSKEVMTYRNSKDVKVASAGILVKDRKEGAGTRSCNQYGGTAEAQDLSWNSGSR